MGSLFLEGLILQASLIFALGAQNLFVFEAGLHRRHPLTVSFVCFLCDLLLIMLGVAGAATIFTQFPQLKIIVGLLGVGFLFLYGAQKLFSPAESAPIKEEVIESTLKKSVLLAVTFSILNPHAYLDAFIIIGGFSSKYTDLQDRLMLGLGAAIFSGIWFLILSGLSRSLRPVFEHPGRMKTIMSVAGISLMYLSGKLGLDVLNWAGMKIPSPVLGSFAYYPAPPGNMFTSILY